MIRNVVLVAAASLLLSSAGFGQEQAPAAGMPGKAREGMGMRQRNVRVWKEAAEKLNLTDAQQKEMRKLRLEMERKNIPLQGQIRLARLEMREEMTADKPDRAKIEKQMKQVSDLELQMKLNRLDHQFAVRGILTPEQLKNWHGPNGMGPQIHRRMRIMRQSGSANRPMGWNALTGSDESMATEEPAEFDESMGLDELIGIDEPLDVQENVILERD